MLSTLFPTGLLVGGKLSAMVLCGVLHGILALGMGCSSTLTLSALRPPMEYLRAHHMISRNHMQRELENTKLFLHAIGRHADTCHMMHLIKHARYLDYIINSLFAVVKK